MQPNFFQTDSPITLPQDDALGRASFAENLARSIMKIQGEDSLVFGISGEWGAGKSSVLKMIEHFIRESHTHDSKPIAIHCDPWWLMTEHFIRKSKTCTSEPIIIHFNPWWFSGRDHLLPMFFSQLNAAIGRSDVATGMGKIGRSIQAYAKALRLFGYFPGASAFKDAMDKVVEVGRSLVGAGNLASKDINQLRDDIDRHLREMKCRIIVFMDDLDRMTPKEMSDVFQLIKAIANFPYTSYILGYDSNIVSTSISRELNFDTKNRHDYLKKIVNIQFDLPPISQQHLIKMLCEQLMSTFADNHDLSEIEEEYNRNCLGTGMEALLQNPRVVKAIINHYRVSIASVENDVFWPDMLVLSVIYVTAPETYRAIANNKHSFLGGRHFPLEPHPEAQKQEMEKFHADWLTKIEPTKHEYIKNLIALLFPNAGFSPAPWDNSDPSAWLNKRRVATAECFDSYFQHRIPEGRLSAEEWNFFLSNIDNADITNAKLLEFSELMNPSGEAEISYIADLLNRAQAFIGDHEFSIEIRKKVLKVLLKNEATIINIDTRMREEISSSLTGNASKLIYLFYKAFRVMHEPGQPSAFINEVIDWNAGIRTVANFLGNKKHKIIQGNVGQVGGINCILAKDFSPIPVSEIEHSIQIFCEHMKTMAYDGQLGRYSEPFEIIRDWIYIDLTGEAKVWLEQQVISGDFLLFWQIIETIFSVPTVRPGQSTYHYRPGNTDFYFQASVARNLSKRILDEQLFELTKDQKELLQQIITHPPTPV